MAPKPELGTPLREAHPVPCRNSRLKVRPDAPATILADGTVAASLRSVSAVIIIDRASGEISWRLGRDILAQQHCPSELPNGNTLVTESAFGRIFEVDRSGQVCWEYVVPYFSAYQDEAAPRAFPDATNAIFRAYRHLPDEVPWLRD